MLQLGPLLQGKLLINYLFFTRLEGLHSRQTTRNPLASGGCGWALCILKQGCWRSGGRRALRGKLRSWCWRRGRRWALEWKLRSWDASCDWRGQVNHQRRRPATKRGPPRKSPSRKSTGGDGLAQRARFGLRKWKGAPRVETTGSAWGGRPPEDDGTRTLEAHRR